MTFLLRELEGLTITDVAEPHDYVQFAFGADIGISIYNDVSLIPDTMKFQELVGKTVSSVSQETDSIIFKFANGTQLHIDMRPHAYHGPEALQFNRRGKPPVIHN